MLDHSREFDLFDLIEDDDDEEEEEMLDEIEDENELDD